MKFDTKIKPSRRSTKKKWFPIILSLGLFLGGTVFYTGTSFPVQALLYEPAKGVVVKAIDLPTPNPLSKKETAIISSKSVD